MLSCVIKVFVQVELGQPRHHATARPTLAAFASLLVPPGMVYGSAAGCGSLLTLALTVQIAAMRKARSSTRPPRWRSPARRGQISWTPSSVLGASWKPYLPDTSGAPLGRTSPRPWRPLLLLLSGGYRHSRKITTVLVAAVTAVHRGERAHSAMDTVFASPPQTLGSSEAGHPAGRGCPGVLRVRDHRCRRVGTLRLSVLVHRRNFAGFSPGARSDDDAWARREPRLEPPSMRARRLVQHDGLHRGEAVSLLLSSEPKRLASASDSTRKGPRSPDPLATPNASLEPTAAGLARPRFSRVGFLLGLGRPFQNAVRRPAANSRLTADFLHQLGLWNAGASRAQHNRLIKLFCVLYPTLSLGLYYAFREPQALIKAGGIAQALMLPFIAGATIYLRQRDADRRVGPSFLSDILTWIAFFSITGVAVYSTYDQIPTLLGGLKKWLNRMIRLPAGRAYCHILCGCHGVCSFCSPCSGSE